MTAQQMITIASSFIGNKEKPGNGGFVQPEFQKLMDGAGWYKGAPWCAFFTRMVLTKAFASDAALPIIKKCCSGNAQQTYRNFKAEGSFKTGSVPQKGALVVWQFGKSNSGHIGIVCQENYATNTMQTVEGNTNGNGSREGDQVAMKLRSIKRDFTATGLNLIGFVYLT